MGKNKILSDSDEANKSGFELPFIKYFALSVGFFFVTIVSAGLLYPLSYYFMTKTEINNIRIDGKKLVFDGKISSTFLIYYTGLVAIAAIVVALNLIIEILPLGFPTYSINYVVSGIITAISTFFIGTRLIRWKKKNTHYDGETKGNSGLKSNIIRCALKSAILSLLGLITVGIAYPISYSVKQKYYTDASFLDGDRLVMKGNVLRIYGKWILSFLIAIITFGIALPLPLFILKRWETENTHIRENGARFRQEAERP